MGIIDCLCDWLTPGPVRYYEQQRELSEAKAEFRQALIEAFQLERVAGWFGRVLKEEKE